MVPQESIVARSEVSPVVRVTRPSVPALWIDTSVILKIWKARNGERIQDLEKYRELDGLITAAVNARKLLCVESHQRDEFSGGRGEWEVLDTLRSLSVGVEMRSWLDALNAQLEAAMRAYLQRQNEILLDSAAFFDRDPVAELNETNGFLIDVRFPEPAALIEARRRGAAQTHEHWEDLRLRLRAEGVTYDEQLAREHDGYLRGCLGLVDAYFQALAQGSATVWDWAGAEPLLAQLQMWKDLGGSASEFTTFLHSQFHARIPIRQIESQLSAHLVTGNDRIRRSDSADVSHLGLVIPISTFVIADAAMERRMKALGIDREWGTEVFSVRTIDTLFSRLRGLYAPSS